MCGRYSQAQKVKDIAARFGLKNAPEVLKPRYNIAPSQDAPVIIEQDGRRLELFRWGLIPSWAKEAAIGHKMINARAETVNEKPSYKRPLQKNRCLVLADGFYEWKKTPAGKVPTRILLKTGEPFAMAGLWDVWKDPQGKEIKSFTIITTTAAESLKEIHERMPVILTKDAEGFWLDPKAEPQQLLPLLVPFDKDALTTYEVSPLINSPANDKPLLIERVG
jgi:putative SOS response-associated peptidase YedK